MSYNLNLNTIIDTIFKIFADSFLIIKDDKEYEIFEISCKQHASKKIRIVFSAPMYRKIVVGKQKVHDDPDVLNEISKSILIAEKKRIKNNKYSEKGTIKALLALVEKTTRDFFVLENHISESLTNALKLEHLIVEDDERVRNKIYIDKEIIDEISLQYEELNIRLKALCSEIQNIISANMSNFLHEYHIYIEQSTIYSWIAALVVTSLLNDNLICETKFSNVDRVEKNIVDYLLAKKCIKKIEGNGSSNSNNSDNIQTQSSSIKEEQNVAEELAYDTSSYIDVLFAKFIHSLNSVYEIKDAAEIEKCQRIIIRGAENFFHATYLSGYDKMNELRNAFQQVRIKIEQINGQYSEAISTMIEICSITLEIKLLDAEIKRILDAMKRADEDLYKLERVKNMLENDRLEMIELKNDLTRDLSTLINSESLGRHLVFKDKGDGN